jgi:regulator of RNase E activity RraA
LTQQIESFGALPGPPVMVFEDLDQPTIAATFGEMMCRTYQAFGAAGLITSGAGRDIDQVRAIDFPCFVGSINPSHGHCHIPTIGEPVTVGGLTVRPGDLLHGDCNGVTSIPHEIASEVADAAQRFVDAEGVLIAYLNSAAPRTKNGYIEAVEELSRQVDELRKDIHGGAKQ